MVITDHYDHLIDDKNRLAIPSQIRNVMDPERDGAGFYLVPRKDYLQLIPEKVFERSAAQTPTGLMPSAAVANARRIVFSNSTKLDPDKQGRVIIPDRFLVGGKGADLPHARMNREVTIVGNGDRLELWNRSEFIEHMRMAYAEGDQVEQTAEKMFGDAPPAP